MARVFVVSDSGHDYRKSEKYGEVTIMFPDKVNVFAADRLVKDVEEKLADSTPDDYLLPSGNAIANCLAFAVFLQMHGKVNFLIYSFRDVSYEVRTIHDAQFQYGGHAT